MWDAYVTPSAWHGVTKAVCGNCSVGTAPDIVVVTNYRQIDAREFRPSFMRATPQSFRCPLPDYHERFDIGDRIGFRRGSFWCGSPPASGGAIDTMSGFVGQKRRAVTPQNRPRIRSAQSPEDRAPSNLGCVPTSRGNPGESLRENPPNPKGCWAISHSFNL